MEKVHCSLCPPLITAKTSGKNIEKSCCKLEKVVRGLEKQAPLLWHLSGLSPVFRGRKHSFFVFFHSTNNHCKPTVTPTLYRGRMKLTKIPAPVKLTREGKSNNKYNNIKR